YPVQVHLPFDFFFQAEDGIRDGHVTGVQTCALPIFLHHLIGWLMIAGAIFPLAAAFRPRSAVWRSGFALAFVVLGVLLYCDRDVAPIFGHISSQAGTPHR